MLLAACVVFVAVWIWTAATAGEQLPGHFDASGNVTRWDSTWSFLAVIGAIGLVIAVTFGAAHSLISRVPGHLINLPRRASRDYWTSPAHRAEFDRKISEDLQRLGAGTVLLLACLMVVSATTTGGSVDTVLLAAPTVLYVVGMLAYCGYMTWGGRYRVPR